MHNICEKYMKIVAEIKKNNSTRIKTRKTLVEAVLITMGYTARR
jgi:hypothetical protein